MSIFLLFIFLFLTLLAAASSLDDDVDPWLYPSSSFVDFLEADIKCLLQNAMPLANKSQLKELREPARKCQKTQNRQNNPHFMCKLDILKIGAPGK